MSATSNQLPLAIGPLSEISVIFAAGILRLQSRAALDSAQSSESAAACLEVLAPAPLSVTTTGVNRGETNPRSDLCN